MLSRASLSLLRQRTAFLPIRSSVPVWQNRSYANKNKPPPGPSSNRKFDSNQRNRIDPSSSKDSKPQEDYSSEQTEFESSKESEQNTAPGSAGAGASARHSRTENQSSQPDLSENQAEFETSNAAQKDHAETEPTAPKRPLPDLTQGIPSTLAAEIEARSKPRGSTSLNLTEDPTRSYEDEAGGEGGDPKDEYVSSLERRRNMMTNIGYAIMLLSGVGGTMYLGRNWGSEEEEKQHPEAPSGWGFNLFFNRIKARSSDLTSYYKDPAFEKLLPDDDPQYRPPYTLVLSLEDLLTHDEWSTKHGWRSAKRPGLDYFLRYLNQYYELVLFTSVPSMIGEPRLRSLDPFRIIRWPLFREATKYENGEYIKDLSYLNRDLSKVIMIDTVPSHAKRQPDNAIILPKWQGNKDKTLVALIPFLEYVAGMGIDDVRPVIKSFEGTDLPVEFAKRQQAMREKFEKQLAEEQKNKKSKRNIGGLASALGMKPQPSIDGLEHGGAEEGKMLWDQIRERGQKQYQMIEKEIQENGEKWLAEMAAEEEKMKQEQMKGIKSGFNSFFGFGSGGDDDSKK